MWREPEGVSWIVPLRLCCAPDVSISRISTHLQVLALVWTSGSSPWVNPWHGVYVTGTSKNGLTDRWFTVKGPNGQPASPAKWHTTRGWRLFTTKRAGESGTETTHRLGLWSQDKRTRRTKEQTEREYIRGRPRLVHVAVSFGPGRPRELSQRRTLS